MTPHPLRAGHPIGFHDHGTLTVTSHGTSLTDCRPYILPGYTHPAPKQVLTPNGSGQIVIPLDHIVGHMVMVSSSQDPVVPIARTNILYTPVDPSNQILEWGVDLPNNLAAQIGTTALFTLTPIPDSGSGAGVMMRIVLQSYLTTPDFEMLFRPPAYAS